jgi:hypothetical protein
MAERELTNALKLAKVAVSVTRSMVRVSSPGLLAKDVAKGKKARVRLR